MNLSSETFRRIIVTKGAASDPRKRRMESVMERRLIDRDEGEMPDWVPNRLNLKGTAAKADATGVNLFVQIGLSHG